MVTADSLLKILVRVAQQFLALAWKELGEKKEIVDLNKK